MSIEFINIYIPEIKKCLIFKGKQRARPYFSNTVVSGFAHHFMTSRSVFDKALNKIASTSFRFPYCASYEEARESVEKLAYYREKPIDIE